MKRYKLKLTSLKFVSSVDAPAQETATAVLLKRGPNAPLEVAKLQAKVAKISDDMGLVFGWALTTKVNGIEYYDLHGDNIVEEDLIKIAAEWMAGGGAADTMHDRVKDGGAMFAMPMTAEVAKGFFGDKFDAAIGTYGLMVAIKPSPEDFAKFKTGELTGFSIDGTGIREEIVTPKSATQKAALFTTEVEGHQHTIELCLEEAGGTWYTSYQTATGAEYGHSHAVMRNADGSLTILADSGHTHDVDAANPAVVVVPADAVIVVENKAPNAAAAQQPAAKSTRPIATPKVEHTMKLVVLTEAQHAHYSKLAPADAEAFIGKTAAERDADIAKAAALDPVVHKTAAGVEIRKSHGELALMLAKQADETAEKLAKATEIATAEKAARESVELTKRADALLSVVKADDNGHAILLGAVESIKDAKQREAAEKALTALAKNTRLGKAAPGFGGSETPTNDDTGSDDALGALEKGLTKFCADQKIVKNLWTDGLEAFKRTTEGAALKRAYDESAAG